MSNPVCAELPCWAVPAIAGVAGLVIGFLVGRISKKDAKGGSQTRSKANAGVAPKAKKFKDLPPGIVEIYVGNLSYDTTEEILRKEFEKFGTVESSRIIMNHFNHKSKGYGFIQMPNREEAEKAIAALNGKEIQGRNLHINEARK